MRHYPILIALLATFVLPTAGVASSALAADAPPASSARLVALGGHFGGFHLGRGGFGRRRVGFGGTGRRSLSHGLLRRIVRAAVFAYILHLFFSNGGISILFWLIVIALVVHVIRRRRARRYAY